MASAAFAQWSPNCMPAQSCQPQSRYRWEQLQMPRELRRRTADALHPLGINAFHSTGSD
jgi:hypothetical protein